MPLCMATRSCISGSVCHVFVPTETIAGGKSSAPRLQATVSPVPKDYPEAFRESSAHGPATTAQKMIGTRVPSTVGSSKFKVNMQSSPPSAMPPSFALFAVVIRPPFRSKLQPLYTSKLKPNICSLFALLFIAFMLVPCLHPVCIRQHSSGTPRSHTPTPPIRFLPERRRRLPQES